MTALIIMAHGSRRQQSNNEVVKLAQCFEEVASDQFQQVKAAFLELAEPSLPEVVTAAIAQGCTSFLIYPYFLNRGRHVEKDIPAQVEQLQCSHPQCQFQLLDHVGDSSTMVNLMRAHVTVQLEDS